MDDPVAYLVRVLFGGGVLTAAVLIIIFVVRGAVARAVQHAANRELAGLQAKFSEQLEDKRQQFARELARERELAERASADAHRAFAKDMERYKTELTIGSETRRQIVTRRLQAIDAIYREGLGLLTAIRTQEDMDVGSRVDMQNRLFGLLREQSYVLDERFLGDVGVIVSEFVEADRAIKQRRGKEEHATLLNDFHVHLAKRVRDELAAMSRPE